MVLLAAAAFLFGTPMVVDASVVMTEVAWMGGAASANHEWIELYNNGSSDVAVDGWTVADGANLLITLSGTIGAGQYAVLERTSDASAPGSAFLVYAGALVNTGATLTLRRGDGQIEDRVVGGENWQLIGGDNVSKQTAQYDGSSWRTASPTPGSGAAVSNVTETPVTPPVSSTNTTTVVTKEVLEGETIVATRNKSRSATTPLPKSTAPLELSIGGQEVMYVNQPVTFSAVPKGVSKAIAASLEERWNFGDLTMATGSKVTHTYTHPGTYIVVVQARFGKHDVVARKEVVVLPVRLSLTKDSDGELLLQNDSIYDVDVSGYRVKVGKETLNFPPLSFVAAKQAVPLGVKVATDEVVLFDFRQRVIARLGVGALEESGMTEKEVVFDTKSNISVSEVDAENSPPVILQAVGREEFVGEVDLDEVPTETLALEELSLTPALPIAMSNATESVVEKFDSMSKNGRWPYGAVALVVLGMLLVVWWPRPGRLG